MASTLWGLTVTGTTNFHYRSNIGVCFETEHFVVCVPELIIFCIYVFVCVGLCWTFIPIFIVWGSWWKKNRGSLNEVLLREHCLFYLLPKIWLVAAVSPLLSAVVCPEFLWSRDPEPKWTPLPLAADSGRLNRCVSLPESFHWLEPAVRTLP